MVECENLVKIYKTKEIEVLALQGLELRIDTGELMAIIGNSGSGKSTFLNMIGGLDRPSAGRLMVDGKDLFKLSEILTFSHLHPSSKYFVPWLLLGSVHHLSVRCHSG